MSHLSSNIFVITTQDMMDIFHGVTKVYKLAYHILEVKSVVCLISFSMFPVKNAAHKERISKTWSSSSFMHQEK